jgi:thioredoxin reductase (NADPH)
LRYCPICDGYEATDKRIAVLGAATVASKKALFMRSYSRDITLLCTDGAAALDPSCRSQLQQAGIAVPTVAVVAVERNDHTITVRSADGTQRDFDVLYPVLGCKVRSELAVALGARGNEIGCLMVDADQRTTVPELYAAGDVVSDLHQISVGIGHAAIAATAIHNGLPRNFR